MLSKKDRTGSNYDLDVYVTNPEGLFIIGIIVGIMALVGMTTAQHHDQYNLEDGDNNKYIDDSMEVSGDTLDSTEVQ